MNTRDVHRELIHAVGNDDFFAVMDALEDGADIFYNWSSPALEIATLHGNKNILRLLLARGAHADTKPGSLAAQHRSKSLFYAIESGNDELVKILISTKTDINATRHDGQTPLSVAAWICGGRPSTVKLLLENGADVTIFSREKTTALSQRYHENTECDELIVNHLIERFKDNPDGLFAFLKSQDQYKNAMKTTWHSQNFNILFKLFIHLLMNSTISLSNLMDLLPSPKEMKFTAFSSEIAAALKALPLMKRGEFIQRFDGISELDCIIPTSDLIKISYDFHIELNTIDKSKGNRFLKKKLYEAAKSGDDKLVKLCLDNGAPVDEAVDFRYDTPLYIAAANGHAEVVELLMSHGARVDQKRSGTKMAPMEVAIEKGHLEVLKVMRRTNPCMSAVLSRALTHHHDHIAKFAIYNNALIPTKNYLGSTSISPLFHAISVGNANMLELMVDKILSWPMHDILNFTENNNIDACISHSMAKTPNTFLPLLRILEHLAKDGVSHADIIAKYLPKSFIGGDKTFKQLILDKVYEFTTHQEQSAYLARLLNPDDYLNHLLTLKCSLFAKNEALDKAAEMKQMIDGKIAAREEAKVKAEEEKRRIDNEEICALFANGANGLNHPIINAASKGKTNCIKTLVSHGYDINARLTNKLTSFPVGSTALHVAAILGSVNVIECLLDLGANINAASDDGSTPLMDALGSLNNGVRTSTVKLLLDQKADALIFTKNRFRSALQLSVILKDLDIIKLIVDHIIATNTLDEIFKYLSFNGELKKCLSLSNATNFGHDELMKLTTHLKDHGYSDEQIKSLSEGCEIPASVSPAYAAATAITDAVAVTLPQVTSQLAAVSQPVAVEKPVSAPIFVSAIELAFSSNDQIPANLPEPMLPTPLTVLELAFTSVNIPVNLPPPMQPETPKLLAETSRLFAPVNESLPEPQQKAVKQTPVMLGVS